MIDKKYSVGWDSREHFTKELILRVNIVLSTDKNNTTQWFEALSDFFDIACCPLDDTEEYENELKDIDNLLSATKVKKNDKVIKSFTNEERRQRKIKAYEKMRKLFRTLMKELWKKRIFVPLNLKTDPKEAMKNMGH